MRAFLTLLLLFFSQYSFAYSVKTHRMLTQKAVVFYNHCLATQNQEQGAITPEQAAQIESGNVWEDLDVPRKMTNWHFYHPDKPDLGQGIWGIGHGSLTLRFNSIAAGLQPHANQSWEDLGRLTHYIQDMTNPAHVAPVYHLGEDRFDNYAFDRLWIGAIETEDCENLVGNAANDKNLSYFQLLDQTARTTLRRLEQSLVYKKEGATHSITWAKAFWTSEYDSKQSQQENFGHYGVFGNGFGLTQLGEIEISKFEYAYFAKMQIRAAILATIQYINKLASAAK